jgi:tetratricopeptide (TPR) repeat protein
MTFEEIVDQALVMLQRRGRVAYRTFKRQFMLNDETLEALKTEIIKAQRLAVDEDGEVLVWTGSAGSAPAPDPAPMCPPQAYTPAQLAEKILTSRAALAGERKQVTVLFADLQSSLELLAARIVEALEALAETLNDARRLGRVAAYMTRHVWRRGEHDRGIESGRCALASAERLGDFALQVMSNFRLGQIYYALGDYQRAMEVLRRNVAFLKGDQHYERFDQAAFPSVLSRAYLVWCLAERGEFAEGLAIGEEAVRIAEAGNHPYSLVTAFCGVGVLALYTGDLQRAISVFEHGLMLCQVGNFPVWSIFTTSSLGYGYALSGRIAEALPLLERAVDPAAAQGSAHQVLRLTHLSEGYLLAGRADDRSLSPSGPLNSPIATKSKAMRHVHSGFSGKFPPTAILPRLSRLKPTTGRLSPWARNSACARLWLTAT